MTAEHTTTLDYLATERQKASWKEYIASDKKMVLNLCALIDVDCPNHSSISQAVHALVTRHESLRTIFALTDLGLRQIVRRVDDLRVSVNIINCQGWTGWYKMRSAIQNERLIIFDLERGPLVRFNLMLLRNGKAKLVVTMQHIISDAISIQILTDDFLFYYHGFLKNETPQRPPLSYQMKDFALWEYNNLKTAEGQQNLAYWNNELEGLNVFQFRKKWLRKKRFGLPQNVNGGEYIAYIHHSILSDIKSLASSSKTTKLCFFCTALLCLLYCLSAQEELMVIVPISLRDRRELAGVVGFLNTDIYIRMKLDTSASTKQMLCSVSEKYFKGLDHRHHQIDQILEIGHYYCAGVLNELPSNKNVIGNFRSYYGTKNSGKKAFFPLFFMLTEFANGMRIDCIYDNAKLNGRSIPELIETYQKLVKAMVQRPDQSISAILESLSLQK